MQTLSPVAAAVLSQTTRPTVEKWPLMLIRFTHKQVDYTADLTAAVSLAIPLQFNGPQPNHFGAPRASAAPLTLGEFTGSTRQGGSCNVDHVTIVPHCNGTHTETVSHIVDEDIAVGHAAPDALCLAAVVTVQPTAADDTRDSYRPPLAADDRVITAATLRASVGPYRSRGPAALIVRTLPNAADKRARVYGSGHTPAFFTTDAMTVINDLGCRHLLVDLPSVDRMYDDGLLTNHHMFWHVPEMTHALTAESRQDKTITEMIYVDDSIPDGLYALNLQIPPFGGDAAPSRPVLLPVSETPPSAAR